MRANEFGDLLSIDHVEIGVGEGKEKVYFIVLIVTDGASNLLWAGHHPQEEAKPTLSSVLKIFEQVFRRLEYQAKGHMCRPVFHDKTLCEVVQISQNPSN